MNFKTIFLCLLILYLGIAFAQIEETEEDKRAVCPGNGNCNKHGSCLNGVCTCFTGYGGNDCSYAVSAISSGVPMTNQQVSSRQWLYYTISVGQQGGLLIVINQTNLGGDVDLYVLPGDFPSQSHYTQKETSTSPSFSLTIPNPSAGVWYIGVYGSLTTTFTITVTTTSSQCAAQNNCNPPKGVCNAQGTCTCNSGWTGSDCTTPVKSITLGQNYVASVASKGWLYYTASITKNNNLQVFVSQNGTGGDVDLYIRYNAVPDLWNYDYRDTSLLQNFNIVINEPSLGVWYFGFYGFQQTNFSFNVSNSNQCPNNCSNHGVCRGIVCQCQSGFNGLYCQNMQAAMTLSRVYSGYVESNSWNYYFVQAQSENNLVVTLNELNNGDCDLYARAGSQPTKFDYDFKNIGTSSVVQLTITNPTGVWYLGVFGYSSCSYTISVNIINTCPGNPVCSGHGTCTPQGMCQCNTGYGGTNCNTTVTPLVSGVTTTGQVFRNGWSYFELDSSNSSFISINIKERSSVGYLWLFALKGNAPDLHNYDYSDQSTSSSFHRIYDSFDSPQTDTWTIGVYANPYAVNPPVSFSISAWYSSF